MPAELKEGYIWRDGVLHDPIPADLIPPDCPPDDFVSFLQGLDGCFRLVLGRGDHTYAAVDRIRSLPIFYSVQGNQLLIATDAFELRARLNDQRIDPARAAEFLLTGVVSGNDTLYPGLKQLEAGQCLIWDRNTCTLRLRDHYRYRHLFADGEPELEELDRVQERVIGRLIESVRGRTIVIPLSGGNDSRLIAVLLRRLGYEKVICFTYGSSHLPECQTSRRVARFLNFRWIMVEQNRRLWYQAFHSQAMRRHERFATHLSAAPHIQDWLAVQILKERGLIPEDSVFVPGHSGDFPEGANLPLSFGDREEISDRQLLDAIFERQFNLWHCSGERRHTLFGERIRACLQPPEQMQPEIAASLFDEWDWRNREAKFIVNSVRVYEFFGYDWRLPLWDAEFLHFWQRVPLDLRLGQGFFRRYRSRYQSFLPPSSNDLSLSQRLRRKERLWRFGNLPDPSYGRWLDYRDRQAFLNTRVGSLLEPNFSYPDFINPDLTILDGQVNGIAALIYLGSLIRGELTL